jgi:hypothetical protein
MDTYTLKKLKDSLPPNSVKNLALRFKVSEDLIRKVLNGKRRNEPILDAAIALASTYKVLNEQRFETIHST